MLGVCGNSGQGTRLTRQAGMVTGTEQYVQQSALRNCLTAPATVNGTVMVLGQCPWALNFTESPAQN